MTRIKDRIVKSHILYVEGLDALNFFICACQLLCLENIQVMDFGGNIKLGIKLKELLNAPKEDDIDLKTIVVIRDIESGKNRVDISKSIKSAFELAKLPPPENEFSLTKDQSVNTAFALLPGPGQDGYTLESLCLSMLTNDRGKECVADYLDCRQKQGEHYSQPHKNELYSYLSGTDKFKGFKIGEAAKAGAFDFEHKAFAPYRDMLLAINKLSINQG